MQSKKLFEIIGSVESVIFVNEKNGYSVIEIANDDENITATGVMPGISVGEELRLIGEFKTHPAYGEQFNVKTYERSLPTTVTSILKYLSSGAIKGIGPSTAMKLVDTFGEKTLEVLENTPERLHEVKGLTKSRAKKISEEFQQLFSIKSLMSELGKYGVTPEETVKIFKTFGKESMNFIQANPYLLCDEPIELSFERADKIGFLKSNVLDEKCRVRAGIVYILKHNMNNGHTCLPRDKLIPAAVNFLEVSQDKTEESLDELLSEGALQHDFFNDREFIFLNKMHASEVYSASRLLMMLKFPPRSIVGTEDKINEIEKTQCIEYADLQKKAIKEALEKGILVLTGGPGTGKTTTLNAIINILEENGERIFLAAPTGRAAKRMSEVTKKEAKTIHRLLEVEWDSEDRPVFKKNEKNLLNCDALILDEISMIDVNVFEGVLRALPLGTRLILVGDSNQLPSVGPGNILSDLISSEEIPLVELKEIFRQSQQSLIVTNAHKIVNGEMPELTKRDGDFFFINANKPEHIVKTIKDLCKTRLPQAYNYSSLDDIQVIAPGKKGDVGTINLNKVLQDALNPALSGKKEITVNGNIFRQGDKVMQIKNNYDIPFVRDNMRSGEGIFNGDIGVIENINPVDLSLTVRFDDKVASYNSETVIDLDLAYAITVHKSQGSEFTAVIMPMYTGAPQLYYRNLLYTGVTRAKNLLIMVGTPWTVSKMVENNKKTKRYSSLKHYLVRGSRNENL